MGHQRGTLNRAGSRQRHRAGVKHEGTVRGWETEIKRSEYQRKRENRKRRGGPPSQRDERGPCICAFVLFFPCPRGPRINRPKQKSELLRKFLAFFSSALLSVVDVLAFSFHSVFARLSTQCSRLLLRQVKSLLIKFILRRWRCPCPTCLW